MVNLVCRLKEAKNLSSVPLCNNTIKHRIDNMSKDIVAQITQELQESRCCFSLQRNKSTDMASCNQLLVFVRYLTGFAGKEEFFFCSPLKATTKSEDIMNIVKHFMEENGIKWAKLRSLCMDGALTIMGK